MFLIDIDPDLWAGTDKGIFNVKYRLLKIAFAVWVGIWLFFVARELCKKSVIRDYASLWSGSLEGKRAYVTGQRLYDFLLFCKANLPQKATYALEGIEDGSIEKRRAAYYLYPLIEAGSPDFVLVFGKAGFSRDGYGNFAAMDGSRYILKKAKE